MAHSPVKLEENEDDVLMVVDDRYQLLPNNPSTASAIRSSSPRNIPQTGQDVLRLDFLSLSRPPTTIKQQSPSSSSNGLTNSISGLKSSTNPPVTNDEVAAAHGIPNILPALPALTAKAASPQPQMETNSNSFPDFASLSKNYITMLSSAPSDSNSSSAMPPPPVPGAGAQPQPTTEQLNNLLEDMIKVSPDLRDFSSPAAFGAPGFGSLDPNFLTSPLFDDYDPTSPLFGDYTPNMDYQSTPLFGDTSDFFTSPLLVDNPNATDNGMNFNDIPLFSSDGRPNLQALPPATPALVNDSSPLMADISSPQLATPHSAVGSFDPAHVASAPSLFEDFAASVASSSSRATKPLPAPQRRAPTGTRRNITPASLIPDDAPTQTRKYTSPSTTSRKELPVTFARKRAAISMVDEDEVLPDLPPNATEREQIEWKRRQNTIAARKSRKRKLEHQQYLETELDRLKRDRDVWKVRAITLRGVLRGKGGDTALAMEEWDQEEE